MSLPIQYQSLRFMYRYLHVLDANYDIYHLKASSLEVNSQTKYQLSTYLPIYLSIYQSVYLYIH